MEEATEKLVKIYLESKGFFVRTNERICVAKNRYPEIDIIAIRLKSKKDNLPNKIIGEVKSWSLNLIHFPFVSKQSFKTMIQTFATRK